MIWKTALYITVNSAQRHVLLTDSTEAGIGKLRARKAREAVWWWYTWRCYHSNKLHSSIWASTLEDISCCYSRAVFKSEGSSSRMKRQRTSCF